MAGRRTVPGVKPMSLWLVPVTPDLVCSQLESRQAANPAETALFGNGRLEQKPHWLESLKGDSGTIESVIRCPDRKMLGDGDGLAAGTELFGGSAGAGAGGG